MNYSARPTAAAVEAHNKRMVEVIGRSAEISWLTTCRDHNRNIRNEVVAAAAQARLLELAGPKPEKAKAPARLKAVEQARAIWPVLTARATEAASTTPAKITVGDLAVAMGLPVKGAASALRGPLALIGGYCVANNLPALNALVVNQATMEASDGTVLPEGSTARTERANVLAYDWSGVAVPSPEALQAAKAKT